MRPAGMAQVEGRQLGVDAESVRTEGLSHEIRYAGQYSGSKGVDKIQAALDDLGTTAGTVVVDGAPDDLSAIPAAEYQSGWLFDKALTVPSRTKLQFENVYVFLESGTNDNIIRNKNADSGDNTRDGLIYIEGPAVLDGNAANQDRSGFAATYPVEMVGIDLYKVDDYTIQNIEVGPTNGWGIKPEDSTNGDLYDILFRQDNSTANQDGIHIMGPSSDTSASHLHGTIGDDAMAVDASGTGFARGSGGDVYSTSFAASSFTAKGAAGLFRTVPGGNNSPSGDAAVDGVSVVGCHARPTASDAIKLGWGQDVLPENHTNIHIAHCSYTGNGNGVAIKTQDKVGALTVHDVEIDASTILNHGSTFNSLTITDSDIRVNADNTGISWSGGNDQFRICNSTIECTVGSTNPAIDLDGGANGSWMVADTTFSGWDTGFDIKDVAYLASLRHRDNTFTNVSTPYNSTSLRVLVDGKSLRTNYGGMPTYTGDGSTGRNITFEVSPTYVAVRGSDGTWYDVHAEFGPGYQHSSPTGELSITSNGIAVGDSGSDTDPNTNGEIYDVYYEV